MKILKNFLIWFLSNFVFKATAIAALNCPLPWQCELVTMKIPYSSFGLISGLPTFSIGPNYRVATEKIRMGHYPEKGPFKGNILYYEGLGDSMLNHAPLFEKLSQAGYRVIAFDYMGQGGSSGKMDRTRINMIPTIGNTAWKKYARETLRFPKKTIIGWSTGGLATYLSATENKVDAVILLAPGIAPNTIVGEGIFNYPPNEITLESLTTSAPYLSGNDPHKEKIKPNSPLKVPNFSISLLTTAKEVQKRRVAETVKGLVLLSGANDTYVDAEKTKRILKKNAPHFKWVQYDGALHEIDNEVDEIRNAAQFEIISFLDSLN